MADYDYYGHLLYDCDDYHPDGTHRCTRLRQLHHLQEATSWLDRYPPAAFRDLPAQLESFVEDLKSLPSCCQSLNLEAGQVLLAFAPYFGNQIAGAALDASRSYGSDYGSEEELPTCQAAAPPAISSFDDQNPGTADLVEFVQDFEDVDDASSNFPAPYLGDYCSSSGSECSLETVSEGERCSYLVSSSRGQAGLRISLSQPRCGTTSDQHA